MTPGEIICEQHARVIEGREMGENPTPWLTFAGAKCQGVGRSLTDATYALHGGTTHSSFPIARYVKLQIKISEFRTIFDTLTETDVLLKC